MDRTLHGGLEPFGIAETPLVDVLFSITRPDKPASTKRADPPTYLTARTASVKPRGTLRHPLVRIQHLQHHSRGG